MKQALITLSIVVSALYASFWLISSNSKHITAVLEGNGYRVLSVEHRMFNRGPFILACKNEYVYYIKTDKGVVWAKHGLFSTVYQMEGSKEELSMDTTLMGEN
jgi:hypothetical protein